MGKYVCKLCGSDDIQIRKWVNPNTNEIHECCEDINYHECWCENCEDITEWELKTE